MAIWLRVIATGAARCRPHVSNLVGNARARPILSDENATNVEVVTLASRTAGADKVGKFHIIDYVFAINF